MENKYVSIGKGHPFNFLRRFYGEKKHNFVPVCTDFKNKEQNLKRNVIEA